MTGAAGYVGSWCVKLLLERGFGVRACVRSAGDRSRVAFLEDLARDASASGKLTLHSCDLTQPGAYNEAFRGCDAVVHTAAGIWSGPTNIQDQKGMYEEMTRSIRLFIDSVNASPSVRRVVYTSSCAAMMDANIKLIERNPILDERRYPDQSDKLAKMKAVFGYPSAKVESEKFLADASAASDGRWDVVMANPGEVIGPILSAHQFYGWAARVAEVAAGVEQTHLPNHRPLLVVDVRDVAEAHLRLLESSTVASGSRYLVVSSDKLYFSDAGRYIQEALPELTSVAVTCQPGVLGKLSPVQAELLWSRLQLRPDAVIAATGMAFRPLLETLRDNVLSVQAICGDNASDSAARYGAKSNL